MLFDKQSLITCIIDYLHCVEKFRPLVHSPILSWKFSVRSCLKENVQFYKKIANVKKVSWGPASLTLFFRTKGGQLRLRVNDVTYLAGTLAEDNIIEVAADVDIFGDDKWFDMF